MDAAQQLRLKVITHGITGYAANRMFEYRDNPVIADIRPRNHLIV